MKFCAQDKDLKKVTCSESLLGYISLGKENGTQQQGNNSTNSPKGHLKFNLFKTTLYFATIYVVNIFLPFFFPSTANKLMTECKYCPISLFASIYSNTNQHSINQCAKHKAWDGTS